MTRKATGSGGTRRPRRRWVQQELPAPRTWGGRRKGAGRPKLPESRVQHRPRPGVRANTPVHVTLRLVSAVGMLRRFKVVATLRQAFLRCCEKQGFRIVHFSIQRHHIHLVCETDGAVPLARGIQGFSISAAHRLNRRIGRRGRVFSDRYHAVPVRSPRQARNVLCYVLQNARRHRERLDVRFGGINPFSSAWYFEGWADESWRKGVVASPHGPPVVAATSWLLTAGWRRHGLIAPTEVPPAAHRR